MFGHKISLSVLAVMFVIYGTTESCESGGTLINAISTGSLVWPADSNDLPSTQGYCWWTIEAPENKTLRYSFQQYDIDTERMVVLGWLPSRVYNLMDLVLDPENQGDYFVYYTDQTGLPNEGLGYTSVTPDRYLNIIVDFDGSVSTSSFHLEYEVIEPTCDFWSPMEIDTEIATSLDYPSVSDKYGVGALCVWRLNVPDGKMLEFKYTEFDLSRNGIEYTVEAADYVAINVGTDSNPEAFHGNSLDGRFFSALSVYVGFLSRGPANDGFIMEWTLHPAECFECLRTNGACVDYDSDGTYTCDCEDGWYSSALGNGCDFRPAFLNELCNKDYQLPCWDTNAVCSLRPDLSGRTFCNCKHNFVVVGDPARCHPTLLAAQDNDCQTCITNDGICYDSADNADGVKDGCLCPPTRASANADCDAQLFTVDCDSTSLTCCYDPHSIPEYVSIFNDIADGDALLYAEGFKWNRACHFTETGGKYCIQLYFGAQGPNCGLLTNDVSSLLTYSGQFRLQRDTFLYEHQDIQVLAYCSFDKKKHISSAAVDVLENRRTGVEGIHHKATLSMTVRNQNDDDLQLSGVSLGDLVKVEIAITDDAAGLFTSLRAEICLISDMLSLNHPAARVTPLLLNGCPTGPLASDGNFQIVNGNGQVIASGYFSVPKFADAGYVFVHCAVKVCINTRECAPNVCVRRRSLDELKKNFAMAFSEGSDIEHKIVAIKIYDYTNDKFERLADDASAVQFPFPLWMLLVGLALSIVITVATIAILYFSLARKRAVYYPEQSV